MKNRCKKLCKNFLSSRISRSSRLSPSIHFSIYAQTNQLYADFFYSYSSYLGQILHVSRSSKSKCKNTIHRIPSKKLKNQKYTRPFRPKKKNNDFWPLWFFGRLEYRNRCTLNERITRNHCLGNAKPHQLVHNTPKKRRIEGRARGEFWSCRFHLGEREHDVSVHCCEQPSGRDTIKLEIFNGFIILPQLGRKYTNILRISGRMRWSFRGNELWMSCCFAYSIRIDRA